jgi:rSAM/selenodomain-associated transferase 1
VTWRLEETARRRTVLVLIKYPARGRVKTRLARAIGGERAAALCRGWIGTVLGKLQALRPATRVVGYFDGADREAFREWHALADDWWPQPAGDLGERLREGLSAALTPNGPALAVGTDCLEIDAETIADAFAALTDKDVVFGPCPDGGYYLVGSSAPRPALFRSVRWSGPFTLADHLKRCREEGWSFALLPARQDIDTWQDWQAYLARTAGGSA